MGWPGRVHGVVGAKAWGMQGLANNVATGPARGVSKTLSWACAGMQQPMS
jgi:hypothetical protein